VVAIAVDSKLDDVRKLASSFKADYPIVMGTPEVVKAFRQTILKPPR
jgi:hypothetical protein